VDRIELFHSGGMWWTSVLLVLNPQVIIRVRFVCIRRTQSSTHYLDQDNVIVSFNFCLLFTILLIDETIKRLAIECNVT
jgi:hypothetical protein